MADSCAHARDKVEMRAFDDEIHNFEFDRPQAAKLWATPNDVRDMDALGIKPTFKRRFQLVAMVGFSSTVVISWQNMLATFYFALYNGGTAGLFWGFLYSMFGMLFVYLTIGELSSAFPTAGGQYQWVSECAPDRVRNVVAYITGWFVSLSWVAFLASCCTIIGNTTKFCILIYYPNSPAINSQWFPTLLALASLIFAALFNIYLAKKLPMIEGAMLAIHLATFVAIVITLWTTSPRGNAQDVLFTFTNPGGWSNAGVASMVGLITSWGSLMGYDSSVHMTENAKDASKTIPYSLIISYVINTLMAFIAAITMIFCLGDIEEVLAAPSPFIAVFLNSTGSRPATVIMTVPITLSFVAALINEVATASRQLWSFARDGGFPFGEYIEPVPDLETPRRAIWFTITLAFAIACINFGPVVGFNAIVSIITCALTISYTLTVGCTICRRIWGRPIPQERFALGRWGLPVNITAFLCALPVTVLSVFPSVPNPTPDYMNWASVVFGFVILLGGINYAMSGRRKFNPPLRKDEYRV